MKRTTSWIRDYFGFSQQETKGFIVLSCILVILICSPLFLQVNSNYSPQQLARDRQLLDSMQVLFAKQETRPNHYKKTKGRKKKQAYSPKVKVLTSFNPNLASQEELEKLGLASYLAKRIVKYRNKGGKFRNKEDLLKIYGFPKALYQEWEAYIKLPKKSDDSLKEISQKNKASKYKNSDNQEVKEEIENSDYQKKKFPKKNPSVFELATADTFQLQQIKGIGSKLSGRIVAFRDKLGGFHSLDQLEEVYGLTPETIIELKKYARLEKTTPSQIDINIADVKKLAKHPYISYKLAKVIVNYRAQHGLYHSMEDLKKIKLIEQVFIEKIAPYIKF